MLAALLLGLLSEVITTNF